MACKKWQYRIKYKQNRSSTHRQVYSAYLFPTVNLRKLLDNYSVPKEFKSAIIKDTDIVGNEEFAIARQEIFKQATKNRLEGKTLSYKSTVLSANHIFY